MRQAGGGGSEREKPMNRSRISRWMIFAALFVFACSPVIVPQAISTLDPASLNTAIAGTAAAAAAGTASQGLQPAFPTPGGDVGLNTAIALTAAAAGTQTAALIPPTLTPSYTPFPTWTASVVPSATQTFIFRLPTFTRTPKPAPTSTPSGGGGGHSGYSCKVISVTPEPHTVFNRSQAFQTVWRVRNTGDDWLGNSADLIYVSGTRFTGQSGFDLDNRVNFGDTVNLPTIRMTAPGDPGTYTTTWNIKIGKHEFCRLQVIIDVR